MCSPGFVDLDVFHAEMEVEENAYRIHVLALFSSVLCDTS